MRRQLAARLARLAAALDDEVWRNPARSGADGFDEDLWHAVRGVESVELVSLAIDDDGVHELRLGVPTEWSSAEINSAVFRILGAVAEQVTFVDRTPDPLIRYTCAIGCLVEQYRHGHLLVIEVDSR